MPALPQSGRQVQPKSQSLHTRLVPGRFLWKLLLPSTLARYAALSTCYYFPPPLPFVVLAPSSAPYFARTQSDQLPEFLPSCPFFCPIPVFLSPFPHFSSGPGKPRLLENLPYHFHSSLLQQPGFHLAVTPATPLYLALDLTVSTLIPFDTPYSTTF